MVDVGDRVVISRGTGGLPMIRKSAIPVPGDQVMVSYGRAGQVFIYKSGAGGSIYVTDFGNFRIQKFDSAGVFLAKWGSYGSGDSQFDSIYGICSDPVGNLYVTDWMNYRVQKFNPSGTFLMKWGTHGSGDGQFNNPRGICSDPVGNIYVADPTDYRIQKFDSAGNFLLKWGTHGSGDGQFEYPYGICSDPSGNIYVVEFYSHRVQKFNSSGTFLLKWGTHGSGDGQFDEPFGICSDLEGNIYVTDLQNHRVQKFNSLGTFILKWGTLGLGDGQFQEPYGICSDLLGNIYVTDPFHSRVQKFSPLGVFLLKWGSSGSGDGQFNSHFGICSLNPFGSMAPIASFTEDSGGDYVTEPATVHFTDTSTNSPTSWLWDFGDGTISTEQNPTHVFHSTKIPITNGDFETGDLTNWTPSGNAAISDNAYEGSHAVRLEYPANPTLDPPSLGNGSITIIGPITFNSDRVHYAIHITDKQGTSTVIWAWAYDGAVGEINSHPSITAGWILGSLDMGDFGWGENSITLKFVALTQSYFTSDSIIGYIDDIHAHIRESFTVTLTATNASGSDTATGTVYVWPA